MTNKGRVDLSDGVENMTFVKSRTRVSPVWLGLALSICLILIAQPARAARVQSPNTQEPPGVFVSVEWLVEHVEDSLLVVIHVGTTTAETSGEFIPGARFLNFQEIVRVRDGLIVEMPTVDQLLEPLETAGVSDEAVVILYGSPAHLPARAYVTLDYLGLADRAAVLDGGLEAWKSAGLPLAETPAQGPRGLLTPRVRNDVLVSADWVEERLDDPFMTLIDSRPEGEYTGRVPVRVGARAGHIPGARNVYWEDLLVAPENPVLRDLQDVRSRFQDPGADSNAIVVNYCWVGMRASYTYLVAKHLGYATRLYDGSWNEWNRDDSLPAVTGSFPR